MGLVHWTLKTFHPHVERVVHEGKSTYVNAPHNPPKNNDEYEANMTKAIDGLRDGNAKLFFKAFLHIFYEDRKKRTDNGHYRHGTSPDYLKLKNHASMAHSRPSHHRVALFLVKSYAWLMDGIIPMPTIIPIHGRRRLGLATLLNSIPGIGPIGTLSFGLLIYSLFMWTIGVPTCVRVMIYKKLVIAFAAGIVPMVGGLMEGILAPNAQAAHLIEVSVEIGELLSKSVDHGEYTMQIREEMKNIMGEDIVYPKTLHGQFV